VLEYFTRNLCSLCGKRHKPTFFIFVERTYRKAKGDTVVILVPRLLCEPHKQLRKEKGIKKQYTITILPGFLVPHSRIPLDEIVESADRSLSPPGVNEQQAAFLMFCEDVKSFRLHFSRIRERLGRWVLFLTECILALNGVVAPDGVAEVGSYIHPLLAKWERFKKLVELYMDCYLALPGTGPITAAFYTQYIHAKFCQYGMGLGP
jgi:hypothetical protein